MPHPKTSAVVSVYHGTTGACAVVADESDVETISISVPEMPWLSAIDVTLRVGRPAVGKRRAGIGYVKVDVRTLPPDSAEYDQKTLTVHEDGAMEASA